MVLRRSVEAGAFSLLRAALMDGTAAFLAGVALIGAPSPPSEPHPSPRPHCGWMRGTIHVCELV